MSFYRKMCNQHTWFLLVRKGNFIFDDIYRWQQTHKLSLSFVKNEVENKDVKPFHIQANLETNGL